MKTEIETALKTMGVTYAVLGLGGMLSQPVTRAVVVVGMAAGLAAIAGMVAYFLARPMASQ